MARKNKKWTEQDDQILTERYQTESLSSLARLIGCGYSTVCKHARELNLWKENPYERNHYARELIRMEHDNLSYKEMAKRTGLKENTVWKICRELGLRRKPEHKRIIMSRCRKELYQSERRRVNWGLDQKTRLKVVKNQARLNLRAKLSHIGYIVAKGENIVYYSDDLVRHPVRERNGERMGLRFEPLPVPCAEETEPIPASLAPAGNSTETFV